MRTKVPLKLQKIIEEIYQRGQTGMTRLTVLKKWFERPERLRSFGIWMAIRAVELGAEADGNDDDERALFDVVKTLLTDADVLAPALDHDRPAIYTIVCGNSNTTTSQYLLDLADLSKIGIFILWRKG